MNGTGGNRHEIRSLSGFAYGYRTASILVDLRAESIPENFPPVLRDALSAGVKDRDPASAAWLDSIALSPELPEQLSQWLWILQKVSGMAWVECGKRVDGSSGSVTSLSIPSPAHAHAALARLLQWILELAITSDPDRLRRMVNDRLTGMLDELEKADPSGKNVHYFLAAAAELDLPVDEVVGQVLQFGQGRKARWLQSSFTDQDPHIGSSLARYKPGTMRVLSDAGFPVPPGMIVQGREQAVNAAKMIGYPVVVKPADLDGGVAVSSGLMDEGEVGRAVDEVLKHRRPVMLEKHIAGRDYRLNVFQGKLLWAVERVPGGVSGDGEHSIRELLDRLNSDPRRGSGRHAPLKKIELDEEARQMMAAKGRNEDSVLERDEFMALRRRSNVSSGGMPVSVMGEVHPDNIRLAIRAAALLGLDIAGIDLLIPNISRSWMEVGGAICEVNAQPQFGSVTAAHVFREILEALFREGGRIPITVVAGAADRAATTSKVSEYRSRGLCVGVSSAEGLFVGDECISRQALSPYRSGKALLRDRRVEAVVLEINDDSVLRTGMSCDRCDQLIVAGCRMHGPEDDREVLNRVLAMVAAEETQFLADVDQPR